MEELIHMCYMVYISTDSPLDIAQTNTSLIRFSKITDASVDRCLELLAFQHKWSVEAKDNGCGCAFRHLHPDSIELGFREPEDWCPEEPDAIEATQELRSRLIALLDSGYHVDLLDKWDDAGPQDIVNLDVDLDAIPAKAFILFENHKFALTKKTIKNYSSPNRKKSAP